MLTNNKIIILLLLLLIYGFGIYTTCFKEVKKLNLIFNNTKLENLSLDKQLEQCETRKIELKNWIKDNKDRIDIKKKKIQECRTEVDALESELNDLKKMRGK